MTQSASDRPRRCPLAGDPGQADGFSIVPILTRPVNRRSALRRGATFTGALAALGTLNMLGDLARIPVRQAWADTTASFPDVQFDLSPYMPPAQTIDGIAVGMPPIHTTFLTAKLARRPSLFDQAELELALRLIEANYPYSPGGVFTHVSYSDDYFARFPASVVAAVMPRTLAGQAVLKRAVAGPTDVAPGARTLQLRRPEFTVPLVLEHNDLLFTVRGDNPVYVADVIAWISGSSSLRGQFLPSPFFDARMAITSSRAMFVQMGLPRNVAERNGLSFASFVNPFSPMWMGFADQQVDASAPAQDVTFVGGHGIKLTTASAGSYFDNGSIQHLSHDLLDLQQFYVDGNGQDEPSVDHREPYDERIQYMFQSPVEAEENPSDPYRDGGGPLTSGTRGAVVRNIFHGSGYARTSAQEFGRIGHNSALHRSGRTADGRPIHQRIDGPGFDALDTTTHRNTPKLQFSGFFPSSDFFADLRRNQGSVDLMDEFDLEEEDHGLERFITATRRQNFLVPPRRHRAFPLVERV